MREKISYNKLSAQQTYLLQRIPGVYNMNGDTEVPEPLEVKQARKVIKRWETQEATRKCRVRKRNKALVRKAQEAVYFDKPEKALAIVHQCEKLLKGCPV